MTGRQEVTSKYYSDCRAGCPGKVKFRSFLFRLTGTLAHPGQRGGGAISGPYLNLSVFLATFAEIFQYLEWSLEPAGNRRDWQLHHLLCLPVCQVTGLEIPRQTGLCCVSIFAGLN